MSSTIIDMAKVKQMLDSGWRVRLWKNDMGSYEARARHRDEGRMTVLKGMLMAGLPDDPDDYKALYGGMTPLTVVEEYDFDGQWLMTEDFTPEQALTRLAYKVHGEII
jgi:hypothetical protein